MAHCFKVYEGRVICEKCGDEKGVDHFRACPFSSEVQLQVEYVNGAPFITSSSMELLQQIQQRAEAPLPGPSASSSSTLTSTTYCSTISPTGLVSSPLPSSSTHVLLQPYVKNNSGTGRSNKRKREGGVVTPAAQPSLSCQSSSPAAAKSYGKKSGKSPAIRRSAEEESSTKQHGKDSPRQSHREVVHFVTAPSLKNSQKKQVQEQDKEGNLIQPKAKDKKWKGWKLLSNEEELHRSKGLLEGDIVILGDVDTRSTRSGGHKVSY